MRYQVEKLYLSKWMGGQVRHCACAIAWVTRKSIIRQPTKQQLLITIGTMKSINLQNLWSEYRWYSYHTHHLSQKTSVFNQTQNPCVYWLRIGWWSSSFLGLSCYWPPYKIVYYLLACADWPSDMYDGRVQLKAINQSFSSVPYHRFTSIWEF